MGKKKGTKKTATEKPETAVETTETVNLRSAPPVERLIGQLAIVEETLEKRRDTLASWAEPQVEGAEPNELAKDALDALNGVVDGFPAVKAALDKLLASGYSPPRKSYTASTEEGDHVAILEGDRSRYEDIMDVELMLDLEVIKKIPGKGGGLIVQASNDARMKVATSHVVKLS